MRWGKSSIRNRSHKSSQSRHRRKQRRLQLESLEGRRVFSAAPFDGGLGELPPLDDGAAREVAAEVSTLAAQQSSTADGPDPVLMVISNQDFWYQDYADTRTALEAMGLEVRVTAKTTDIARPAANSGQGADGGHVQPDLALSDVEAEDYSAIVFSGGWGMAQYQYGFEGTYHNSAYRGDSDTKLVVNDLVNEFLSQDKHVAAICYGVSVLAYSRLDGESLLAGREVAGWHGPAPGANGAAQNSRIQIESNGARMFESGAIGDNSTSTDDVFVDGKIITAENYRAATAFGETIAEKVIEAEGLEQPGDQAQPKPVLMVIANQDFYHREYFETRESLEAAGLEVVVAAATTEVATPHAISVVEGRDPHVVPDLALANVDADDFSAIVFVGGYGAASYQYANETVYDNAAYRGSDDVKRIVNDLINEFIAQDKYLTAICNGVSVLAWARVDGVSPLAGRRVTAWAHQLPTADGGVAQFTRDHVEANGAFQFLGGAIGDPTTSTDDVFIDGKIITAENYDSAYQFGRTIADRLWNG